MIMHGLNFEGTDDTDDGTGIDQIKMIRFFESWRNLKGPSVTIGLTCFPDIEMHSYLHTIDTIKRYGHSILYRFCDSSSMASYNVARYRKLYQDNVKALGSLIGPNDIVEVANEVSGEPYDDKWPGPHAAQKMNAALGVCGQSNKRTMVTLFYCPDSPGFVWKWVTKHGFIADYVSMSIYPLGAKKTTDIDKTMTQLAVMFPRSKVLVGEYGCERADTGKDVSTPVERAAMIDKFEARPPVSPNDVVGGFYWDAYQHLVAEPDEEILATYRSAWGF